MLQPEDSQKLQFTPDGELSLLAVQSWHAPLTEALAAGRHASVDLSSATAVDLPALQFLLAARRTFSSRGLGFEILDPAGLVQNLCRQAGIDFDEGARHE